MEKLIGEKKHSFSKFSGEKSEEYPELELHEQLIVLDTEEIAAHYPKNDWRCLLRGGTTRVDQNHFTLYITFGVSFEEHLFPLLFILCPTENSKYLSTGFEIWIKSRRLRELGYLEQLEYFGSNRSQAQFNAICKACDKEIRWCWCDYHISQISKISSKSAFLELMKATEIFYKSKIIRPFGAFELQPPKKS